MGPRISQPVNRAMGVLGVRDINVLLELPQLKIVTQTIWSGLSLDEIASITDLLKEVEVLAIRPRARAQPRSGGARNRCRNQR